MTTEYLKLIIGPMFSGKTTELINLYNEYKQKNDSCVVINHIYDKNRFNDENQELMYSHNKNLFPIKCLYTEKLLECDELKLNSANVILINESQFFEDLIEFVNKWLINGKKIYVSGLSADSNMKKFGKILDLISLADDVVMLKGTCYNCKSDAAHTLRLLKSDEQILIGTENVYMPVCRTCYLNYNVSTRQIIM